MDEELEQEFPASGEEEITGAKKDPFSEVLDGGDVAFPGEQPTDQMGDGSLTDQQPSDQPGDGSLVSGFTELEMQQLQELIQQQSDLASSISVDDAAVLLKAQTVELSSVILFCALLISGTIASIKLWGGHWSGS